MKAIYIIIAFSTYLFANSYEIKLYETIFTKLFNKPVIYLFVDKNKKEFKNSKVLKIVNNCKKADLVLLYDINNLKCKDKPLFVTSYIDFKNSNAIGAFYWRKGRPQLILNKKIIESYNLHLDKSLLKYVK